MQRRRRDVVDRYLHLKPDVLVFPRELFGVLNSFGIVVNQLGQRLDLVVGLTFLFESWVEEGL